MINQFKDDYKKLISDFSVIDENDPITIDKLNQVTSILDSSCLEFEKMKSDNTKGTCAESETDVMASGER
mgnify:CR=1 FL=1